MGSPPSNGPGLRHRLLRWARLVLPVVALVMLSTLFMVLGGREPVPAPGLGPEGLRAEGARIESAAREVLSDRERGNRALAEGLSLDLQAPGGMQISLSARGGDIRLAEDRAEFWDGVEIATSTGYRLRAERLKADLETLEVESMGPVTGEGPAGRLSAEYMRVQPDRSGNNAHVLVFKGSVRLIYEPDS